MVDVYLEGGLQIKDVAARRELLLQALEGKNSICIDVNALSSVDTAGVQLLLSLVREATRRDIKIEYVGHSPALTDALSQLGLTAALRRQANP